MPKDSRFSLLVPGAAILPAPEFGAGGLDQHEQAAEVGQAVGLGLGLGGLDRR